MASETILKQYLASQNVYFAVTDATAQYFDFDDNSFKALASCTTPFLAATEKTDGGGVGLSDYVATLDLSLVNKTGTVGQYALRSFLRAGADPDPLVDTAISPPIPLVVQFGRTDAPQVRVQFQIATKTTSGNAAQLKAWLEIDGQVADLATIDADATCDVVMVMHGHDTGSPDLEADTANFGDANADNIFSCEKNDPGFTGDRAYLAFVTITENGKVWDNNAKPFNVFA